MSQEGQPRICVRRFEQVGDKFALRLRPSVRAVALTFLCDDNTRCCARQYALANAPEFRECFPARVLAAAATRAAALRRRSARCRDEALVSHERDAGTERRAHLAELAEHRIHLVPRGAKRVRLLRERREAAAEHGRREHIVRVALHKVVAHARAARESVRAARSHDRFLDASRARGRTSRTRNRGAASPSAACASAATSGT